MLLIQYRRNLILEHVESPGEHLELLIRLDVFVGNADGNGEPA
jgi:hypothetical protein